MVLKGRIVILETVSDELATYITQMRISVVS